MFGWLRNWRDRRRINRVIERLNVASEHRENYEQMWARMYDDWRCLYRKVTLGGFTFWVQDISKKPAVFSLYETRRDLNL